MEGIMPRTWRDSKNSFAKSPLNMFPITTQN